MRVFRLSALCLTLGLLFACGEPSREQEAASLGEARQALTVPTSTAVTVVSPKAILEPSTSPSDKDGYPPQSSGADPEEGTLGVKLAVASPVRAPRVVVTDDNADAVDDLTINEVGASAAGVTRDVDGLDGLVDGVLAPGTYFLYFNLDKTNYDINLPASSATASLRGDIERYTVSLQGDGVAPTSQTYTISMQGSASIDQNDLRWLETAPGQILATLGETFVIRTKYSHQSAGSLYEMILQSYYQGRAVRLEQVNLYYYDTNGAEIPSVQAGVPAGWKQRFVDTPYLPEASQPATLSSGDRWVGEFTFRVVGAGGSHFVPYFQTKPSINSNWKIDTGYDGFQVEPPGEINPAVLDIHKAFGSPAVVSGLEPPVVGSPTTYDLVLTVSNTGLDDALNTVVTDVIPAGVTFAGNFVASQGSATWDAATARITWNVGTLAADPDGATGPQTGGSATLHFHVTVTPTQAQVGTTIRLNDGAYANGISRGSGSPVSAGPSEALDTTAVGSPRHELSLTKAVDRAVASPGDSLTYTLTYRNSGNLTETNVVVSDVLPPRTHFVSASAGGSHDAGTHTVSWAVGSLAPGASGTVSFVVTLDATFPAGTTVVTNTGALSSSDVPSTPSNPVSTSVNAAPRLALTKAVDRTSAAPGDVLTYTLTYTNSGNADATGVTVSDTLPERTSFLSASNGGTFTGSAVLWQLGTVPAGASGTVSFTVRLHAVFPSGTTQVTNIGTVSSETTLPVDSNPVVTEVVAAPALSLTKTVDRATAAPGELLTYTLAYRNTGNAEASGAVITDTLPARTTFVSASGGGVLSGGTVTWNLGTVAAGASGSVTLTVRLDAVFPSGTTVVANTAVLTGHGTPPTDGGTQTTVDAAPALALSKAVDLTTASPGQHLTYTLSYRNTGNADARDVVLSDALPARATFVSASNGGTFANGTVTWSLGTVGAGTSGSVTVTVQLDAVFPNGTTTVTNTASASSANAGTVGSNPVTTTVSAAPSLSVTKAVDLTTASPGQQLTYTLSYANSGNADATGVVLSDALPAHTSFVSASDGGGFDGATVRWSLGTLAPGASGSVTFTARLDTVFPAGQTTVTNSAVLNSGESGPVSSNEVVTVVTANPRLAITKVLASTTRKEVTVLNTASVASAQTGAVSSAPVRTADSRLETLTYRIEVTNSGDANATQVVVTDVLDANVAFVSATGGTYDAATRTVSWTQPSLAAGGSWSVELVVSVP